VDAVNFLLDMHNKYSTADSNNLHISVELIESCVNKLKLGKASGPDELKAEHT
jgi:hypothetical protein